MLNIPDMGTVVVLADRNAIRVGYRERAARHSETSHSRGKRDDVETYVVIMLNCDMDMERTGRLAINAIK